MASEPFLAWEGVAVARPAHGGAARAFGLIGNRWMSCHSKWLYIVRLKQALDMKIWMMTFAMLLTAAVADAQDSRLVSREQAGQGGVYRSTIHSGEFYGELVSFTLANNENVKFNADDIMLRMTRDQDFLKALENLRTYRFESTVQALNVLASHGWEVRSSMVVRGRNGDEQHYLLARPVDAMMPVSPWLEQRGGASKGQK